jgi:hypothetical protein
MRWRLQLAGSVWSPSSTLPDKFKKKNPFSQSVKRKFIIFVLSSWKSRVCRGSEEPGDRAAAAAF